MPVSSIDDVIAVLEDIISYSIKTNSRSGYFAALYLKVTESVKRGIAKGQFQDGSRMEKLDVTFANRYLDAYYKWQNGQEPGSSWKLAFQAVEKSSPLVLQQLLLGMSAHINLDLGIATVEVSGDAPLEDIHTDFDTINTIISSLTYEVLADLRRVSPLLSLLGLHADNNSVLIQFSINNARDGAWCFAEDFYEKKGNECDSCIRKRDQVIFTLGKSIAVQTGFLKFTIWLIHLFEWRKPSKIIAVLQGSKKHRFTIDNTLTTG